MRLALVPALALLFLSAACSDDEPGARPTVVPITENCRHAWEAAQQRLQAVPPLGGGVAPADPVSPVPTAVAGSIMDLVPTVDACGSTEEWIEGYRAHPAEATEGLDAVTALRSLCARAVAAPVREGPLCTSVQLDAGSQAGPGS